MESEGAAGSKHTQLSEVSRKAFGALGEEEALRALEAQGYRIVDTNVRPFGGHKRGEIDILAWDREYLVFVEVKARRTSRTRSIAPSEAVDLRKRKQLISLAEAYVLRHSLDGIPCRFDVVEVSWIDGAAHLNVIKNAFDGNDV